MTKTFSLQKENIILLGDFNAAEHEDTMKPIVENDKFLKKIKEVGFSELKSSEEIDTGNGHYTHYVSDEGRKLDHIFVSKEFYKKFEYELNYIDEVNYGHPKHKETETVFTDHSGIKVIFKEKTSDYITPTN